MKSLATLLFFCTTGLAMLMGFDGAKGLKEFEVVKPFAKLINEFGHVQTGLGLIAFGIVVAFVSAAQTAPRSSGG